MQYSPVMSWGNACGKCMHQPVMSWADHVVAACTYCMGSKVSSLSHIYLYSRYFGTGHYPLHRIIKNHTHSIKSICLQTRCKTKPSKHHRHLKIIDCFRPALFAYQFCKQLQQKKKKRRLFCAALVAGTINKLEQSILRLRYLWQALTKNNPSSIAKNYKIKLGRFD